MSDCKLLEKAKELQLRRHFKVEMMLGGDSAYEIRSIIRFLRTAKEFEGLSMCSNWAERLADIIEGK